MKFEKNIRKTEENTRKETVAEIVKRALDIISSGNFIVKGFGWDEGKFFKGKTAHLMEDGRINFEYMNNKKGKVLEQINSDSVSVEEFLKWQEGGMDGLS